MRSKEMAERRSSVELLKTYISSVDGVARGTLAVHFSRAFAPHYYVPTDLMKIKKEEDDAFFVFFVFVGWSLWFGSF